jgi:DNA-binding protein H-NS
MNDTLETLSGLNDEELRTVIGRAEQLLKAHDDERKAKALADARAVEAKAKAEARALLASAGLSFKDITGKRRIRSGKAPAYHAGRSYQHPANKALTWNGKGQKPGWLRELEGEGGKPVELAPQVAKADAPSLKKTG